MSDAAEAVRSIAGWLASVTSWLNWEALAAIGTVGALWFAVVQSTRSWRAERGKSIGILTFLIGLIEPLELVPIYENFRFDDLAKASDREVEDALQMVRRAIVGLESLPLDEASEVGVVEWTMALPIALREIEKTLEGRLIRPDSPVLDSIRYTQEASVHFRVERDRLKHGVIRGFLEKRRLRKLGYPV